MQTISIQSTDTLFFRDGRPFSMGDDSFAQGLFPPPPSVLFGALRSSHLALGLDNDELPVNLIEESSNLEINLLAYECNQTIYFPMPLDLVISKGNATPLKMVNKPDWCSIKESLPKILVSTIKDKIEDEPFFISLGQFEQYINGVKKTPVVKKRSDFITAESKIGIGRERDSNISDSGKLFKLISNRMATDGIMVNKTNFILCINNLQLPDRGWLALGGERRLAFFKTVEQVVLPCPILNNKLFKIILSTPCVFKSGWKPSDLLEKLKLKLQAAVVGRPTHIGGWDVKQKKPKHMLQCVPAGSVFYVEAESIEDAQKAAQVIHGTSISDEPHNAQGFGIAYIGKINQNL
jgi:CRISPR-associated protein Cmr3